MKPELDKHPEVTQRIVEAYKELGLEYEFEPIRGGTDGAHLTYRGLPCPNLATGDYNCHGRFEYVDVDEMKKMIEVVYKLNKIKSGIVSFWLTSTFFILILNKLQDLFSCNS